MESFSQTTCLIPGRLGAGKEMGKEEGEGEGGGGGLKVQAKVNSVLLKYSF